MDGGGQDTGFAAEQGQELADALNVGVGGVDVQDGAITNHVVDHDQGSRTREFQGPLKIGGIIFFVGVDEDQIKRFGMGRRDFGEDVQRPAHPEVNEVFETGGAEIFAGYLGVLGVVLEGNQASIGRKSARQPYGAVAAQGADFEDVFCV